MSRAGDAEQAHPRTHHGNIGYTNPLLKPFEAQEAFWNELYKSIRREQH